MADKIKVVTVEADEAALDAVLEKIRADASSSVRAQSVLVLANRDEGKAVLVLRYNSDAQRRLSVEPLDALNPPPAGMRRVLVENYEVALER
jgi:hypothetical protein